MERDKAEALAEAQQEFFAKDVATEDFVRTEIQSLRQDNDGLYGYFTGRYSAHPGHHPKIRMRIAR